MIVCAVRSLRALLVFLLVTFAAFGNIVHQIHTEQEYTDFGFLPPLTYGEIRDRWVFLDDGDDSGGGDEVHNE